MLPSVKQSPSSEGDPDRPSPKEATARPGVAFAAHPHRGCLNSSVHMVPGTKVLTSSHSTTWSWGEEVTSSRAGQRAARVRLDGSVELRGWRTERSLRQLSPPPSPLPPPPFPNLSCSEIAVRSHTLFRPRCRPPDGSDREKVPGRGPWSLRHNRHRFSPGWSAISAAPAVSTEPSASWRG